MGRGTAATKSPETSTAISRPRVTRIPAKQQPADDAGDEDEFSMVVLEWPVGRGNLSLPPRRGRSKKSTQPKPYGLWGGAAGVGLMLLWGLIHLVIRPGVEAKQPTANGRVAGTQEAPASKSANEPPAAVTPPPVPSTREVVERVLQLKGEVVAQNGENSPWVSVKSIDDLPEGATVKTGYLNL